MVLESDAMGVLPSHRAPESGISRMVSRSRPQPAASAHAAAPTPAATAAAAAAAAAAVDAASGAGSELQRPPPKSATASSAAPALATPAGGPAPQAQHPVSLSYLNPELERGFMEKCVAQAARAAAPPPVLTRRVCASLRGAASTSEAWRPCGC